ncbi:hypothetical protein [Xenorhabdus lircayensis]|uniref:Uncharacterized protein n=1 Tax=Xenorhabdus lircayensis TaxID=2763499 RepID=A0ABS0U2Z4_9GAMM|nr:hypothetical protein [Xenorhabdus lircayensis]MBI6548255.1 hypothetical protein [Xenorhabdus lircayensis]
MQPENLTGKVVIATLKSWRFVSGISAFAALMATAVFMTTTSNHAIYAMSLFSALLSQYYCWRTWLDSHYFQLLNLHTEKNAEFDQALLLIFNKTPRPRTQHDRFQGAIKLLKRAVMSLTLQLELFLLFILVR